MADPDKGAQSQQHLKDGPQPGEVYRHYKGDEYEVVCCSVQEDTLQQLVTYRSLKFGYIWTRTLANWSELVDGQSRFTRVR